MSCLKIGVRLYSKILYAGRKWACNYSLFSHYEEVSLLDFSHSWTPGRGGLMNSRFSVRFSPNRSLFFSEVLHVIRNLQKRKVPEVDFSEKFLFAQQNGVIF